MPTCFQNSKNGDDVGDGTMSENADPFTRIHALIAQASGESIGRFIELSICNRLTNGNMLDCHNFWSLLSVVFKSVVDAGKRYGGGGADAEFMEKATIARTER